MSALAALRDELRARHGWTHVDVSVGVDADARRLVLRGEVAVERLVGRVVEVAAAAAPGWAIEPEALRVMDGGTWHALPLVELDPVVLWAACPERAADRRVATELRPEDGPLQRLGAHAGWTVARGRDGTVGWLEGGGGVEVPAPRLPAPHGDDPEGLVREARSWLGVPYRLGGVTKQAVDCSALVQRLLFDQLGVLVPRHSSDQLLVAPRPGKGTGPGDLVFVWSARESLRGMCHVGIAAGGSVIHASLSRRGVVEDTTAEFLADARGVMHVPFGELLAFGRRVAGHASLVAAGVRLGAQP
ncbi:NlpC/P60 family protein [Paraliomyxa miuraensis]|nr:NlpC/P60 family protein [Paraliomyxa miuraensis]